MPRNNGSTFIEISVQKEFWEHGGNDVGYKGIEKELKHWKQGFDF